MSSDSSEDENLDLLAESIDVKFLNESMFSQKVGKNTKLYTVIFISVISFLLVSQVLQVEADQVLPSLRPNQDEDDQFNLFRVTPQFQAYVAKHLSKLLEEKLQKVMTTVNGSNDTVPIKKNRKTGVKLLKSSLKFLRVSSSVDNTSTVQPKVTKPKRKFSEEICQADLEIVAVEPEDILSQKDTKYWSKRTKAPVFHYKVSNEGSLVEIEPPFK